MIVVEDDRQHCLYYHISKRAKWRYAEYGWCYASYEYAITAASRHANGKCAQILIEDMDGENSNVIIDIGK